MCAEIALIRYSQMGRSLLKRGHINAVPLCTMAQLISVFASLRQIAATRL